ncbi:universal stress protein [Microbacterium oryzae]|uniref:universal stress protein n=1 Tax=Microbacterium oryzae TaxID=743009 RepID=UPI0025AF547A|nr:universal stress protein [Microbacterium oryzae]MDN3311137.1 universal stress protein [Microbacterium oryzae]
MKNIDSFPRRIVGVDGSAPSRAALRWATARSRDDRAPLVVVHVAHEREAGEAVLAEARRFIRAEDPDLAIESLRLEGRVWQVLSAAARAEDTLVIGTDKTGLVRGRVSGALSVQLAMTAPCAVAVIPDFDLGFRRGIVVGIGRPESAPVVATGALAEARRNGAPLTLVHGGCTGHCTDGLDAAEQELAGHDTDLVVRRRVLASAAADALLDAALDKELVVLGRASRAASGAPIGTVTHAVLMNATAPVLLLPPT